MRRAPERRRVRLWKFFQREREGICRARRRVSGPGRRTGQFCWAIRRPSTRTMRTRIAALSPKDAVAVPSLAATAACLATWAGGLLFGVDGVAGLRLRNVRECLPRPRDRLGRRDSPGFDQGLSFVPSCPASLPKVSRRRRAAASGCPLRPFPVTAWRIRVDSPPPPRNTATWPIRACCRRISPATPECRSIPEAAPKRRQPQAAAAAPLPDSRRLSGSCQSGRNGSRPAT